MIKIITENLNQEILDIMENSNEIKILTAFLKQSGLEFLNNISHKNIDIITGIDFFVTDPQAVLFLENNSYNIKIFHQPDKIFHPKCFYIKTDRKEYLIVGSSNVTSGGMKNNYEISLLIEKTYDTEKTFNDFKQYFERIKTSKYCFSTESIIFKKYLQKYNENKIEHKQKLFEEEVNNELYVYDKPVSEITDIDQDDWINHDIFGIGYVIEKKQNNIDVFFFNGGRKKLFINNLITKIFSFESKIIDKYFKINNQLRLDEEIHNYNETKTDELEFRRSFYKKWKCFLTENMKPTEIHDFFDEAGKIWTLMTLKKNIVSEASDEFNNYLDFIRDNKESIYKRFEIVCNKASSGKSFNNISHGITSTILSIIYPDECIVYNNASDDFMNFFGIELKSEKSEKTVDKYFRWILFCNFLKNKYKFEDLLDVDCFIGYIKVKYLRNN